MDEAVDLSMKKTTDPGSVPTDYVDLTLEDVKESFSSYGDEQEVIELPEEHDGNTTDDVEWDTNEMNEANDDQPEYEPDEYYPEHNYQIPMYPHDVDRPYEIGNVGYNINPNFHQQYRTNNNQDGDFGITDLPMGAEGLSNERNFAQANVQQNNHLPFCCPQHGAPQNYNNVDHAAHGHPYEGHPPHGNQGFNPNQFFRPGGVPVISRFQHCVTSTGGEITFSYCKINMNDPRNGPMEWGAWGQRPFPFGNNF